MASEFILHYSDDAVKVPLMVPPRTLDQASTSLTLLGKGAQNCGTPSQENLLHLLENFCSDISPTSPTEGQLWYDSVHKVVKVCTGFVRNPYVASVNLANPQDPSYKLDVNGIRIPVWNTVSHNTTISSSVPTGGSDGDIWYQI